MSLKLAPKWQKDDESNSCVIAIHILSPLFFPLM